MARASHDWKVYCPNGTYVASCRDGRAAAAIVAIYGVGSAIKFGHNKTVWREGALSRTTADRFEAVAATIAQRKADILKDAYIKAHGQESYNNVMAGRA